MVDSSVSRSHGDLSRRKSLRGRFDRWTVARLGVFLALIAAQLSPADAVARISLVFGVYSSDKPSAMVTQLRPALNLISKLAGDILGEEVEIRLQVVRSYKAGIDHLVAGKFDFMRLGPASYVMVKSRDPGIRILAMEKKNGKKTFDGIISVPRDSNLTDIRQLRGKTFAFGSKRSTLGRYFAQLTLLRAGIYAKDLKRYEYLGRHDKVGMAVGARLFDAGALEETTFAKLVSRGVPIRALAKYSNATRPWVVRADFDDRLYAALRRTLLKINNKKVLKALRFDGFLPGDDSDYEPTRVAIRENPRFFGRN